MRNVFLMIAVACGPLAGQAAQDDLQVEYVVARAETIPLDIELTGEIDAVDSVDLGFRQAGRVIDVLVEVGDRVTPDQPLGRLDAIQQEQQLNVAESGLASARAAEEQARQASDRAIALLERGIGTRADRDAASQALSTAEGAVRRAESNVETARRALTDTVLSAPQGAVVTGRNMAPGQIVSAAQSVISLARVDELEAVFKAADHPLLEEAMGAALTLIPIDIDRAPMRATIVEIAPLVDPTSGTVTVRAAIDTVPDSADLLGAAVRGHMTLSGGVGLRLPWTALTRQGNGPAVWVVGEDDRVSIAPVELLRFVNGAFYISEGVEDGQIVVGAGSQLLYPGRNVRPAPSADASQEAQQ